MKRLQFAQKKIIEPQCIAKLASQLKNNKKSISTLNGSFDILHAGHLYIIYEAAQQADILIVALNSDTSIRQYKGTNRPIIPLQQRLIMISALEFVDYVTWFDEMTPNNILSQIKPNVHINGIEYGEECVEAETVTSYGGRIHLVKYVDDLSTTNIVKKIKQCC